MSSATLKKIDGLIAKLEQADDEKDNSSAPAVAAGPHARAAVPQGRFKRSRVQVVDILRNPESFFGKDVTVCGWVVGYRNQKTNKFININDGSSQGDLQLVVNRDNASSAGALDAIFDGVTNGVSVRVQGKAMKSGGGGQVIDVVAGSVAILGRADPKSYPFAKGAKMKMESSRDLAHLRVRDPVHRAIHTVRNACAFATHKFFQGHGMQYVHTPLITGADCEGAGETFTVTNMLGKNRGDIPVKEGTDEIDYAKDFFAKQVGMTVSGQLNVETYAHGLSDVYTFGPTFRAENSHTSRHLAEFWMIEPEICFASLEDVMALAEDYTRFCIQEVLTNCRPQLEALAKRKDDATKKVARPDLVQYLESVSSSDFARVSYTEAVELLSKEIAEGRCHVLTEAEKKLTGKKRKSLKKKLKGKHVFEETVFWGVDFASEHEKYLVAAITKKPTIVYNYPMAIKSFYMKQNEGEPEDRKTVQAMDLLVPGIGELIGGSAREDHLDRLIARMNAAGGDHGGPDTEEMSWYLDLRRYGSVPHGGFGLGFERLVMLCTGVENIRDVIPFPRYPGHAAF